MTEPMTDEQLAWIRKARGILPLRDGAPPSELVVRSFRGDHEPLLGWQRGRIAELEADVERLRDRVTDERYSLIQIASAADVWANEVHTAHEIEARVIEAIARLSAALAERETLVAAVRAYEGAELRTADYLEGWSSDIRGEFAWGSEWLHHVADALRQLAPPEATHETP